MRQFNNAVLEAKMKQGGLSLSSVAGMIGTSDMTVRNMLKGNEPSSATIKGILNAFPDLTYDDLFPMAREAAKANEEAAA
jgi:transcriptional regulator with XRE-family HTH domain